MSSKSTLLLFLTSSGLSPLMAFIWKLLVCFYNNFFPDDWYTFLMHWFFCDCECFLVNNSKHRCIMLRLNCVNKKIIYINKMEAKHRISESYIQLMVFDRVAIIMSLHLGNFIWAPLLLSFSVNGTINPCHASHLFLYPLKT